MPLETFGDSSGRCSWSRRVSLTCGVLKPGTLFSILQCAESPLTQKQVAPRRLVTYQEPRSSAFLSSSSFPLRQGALPPPGVHRENAKHSGDYGDQREPDPFHLLEWHRKLHGFSWAHQFANPQDVARQAETRKATRAEVYNKMQRLDWREGFGGLRTLTALAQGPRSQHPHGVGSSPPPGPPAPGGQTALASEGTCTHVHRKGTSLKKAKNRQLSATPHPGTLGQCNVSIFPR